MHDPSEWNRLDTAGFRVSMKRSVRRVGWILAVVGAFAGACGVAGAFPLLVAIGLVFFCAGAWNAFRPSVVGLAVDGVAMILAGALLSLASFSVHGARPTAVGRWAIAGVVQIVWGIRRLATYRTARFTLNDPQAIARLEALVQELAKRKAADDPTVVEFRTGRFRSWRNRLGLYAEGAIGLLEHQVVRLERRGDISIEVSGTTWHGRSSKVRIQMSDLQLVGQMSADHFERFERWKLGASQTRSIAA